MKKWGALFFILLMLLFANAGFAASLSFDNIPDVLRPGRLVRLTLTGDEAGEATVTLLDSACYTVAVLKSDLSIKDGSGNFTWDGLIDGEIPEEGNYYLYAQMGESYISTPLVIGTPSPVITAIVQPEGDLVPGDDWNLVVTCSMPGTLEMQLDDKMLVSCPVNEGDNDVFWTGAVNDEALAPGIYTLTLRLLDDTGYASNAQIISVSIGDPAVLTGTTVTGITTYNTMLWQSDLDWKNDGSFWTLEMGVMDEAAIWQAMTAPITVIDTSNQKALYPIYKSPDDTSEIVGEVTGFSQGLHVLETLDSGWSLVQCYSSSTSTSKSNNYAGFCEGYIQSNLLKTREVNQTYGLLVDKLTQTLYIYKDGHLLTTLLVSTGKSTLDKPFNETVSGEYIIASRTGGFWSGNMYCDLALRVNGGCLLHEVPCLIDEDGSRYYSTFEAALGTKASHGCIRVQRKANTDGINMTWLWDNIKVGTRILIWEDKGRTYDIPDDDTPLYYNPDGGQYYHADQYCTSVKSRYLPLSPFSYGELEDEAYASLKPCVVCNPPKRIDDIIDFNTKNSNK